jgi:hypothetical protein
MIPAAARSDSENLGGASGVRMSSTTEGDDEHPSPSLGHSEPLRVQNSVGPPIPEVPQTTGEFPKVPTLIAGEESKDVLQEDGVRSVALHKVKEGDREPASGEGSVVIAESSALAGVAKVLAREATRPETSAGG